MNAQLKQLSFSFTCSITTLLNNRVNHISCFREAVDSSWYEIDCGPPAISFPKGARGEMRIFGMDMVSMVTIINKYAGISQFGLRLRLTAGTKKMTVQLTTAGC